MSELFTRQGATGRDSDFFATETPRKRPGPRVVGPRYSTNCDLKVWSQVEKSFCNFLFPICAEQLSRAIQDMAASSAAGSGSSPCPCSTPVQIYGGRAQPPEARARAHHPGAGLHMRACETIRCSGASCHEAQRRHAAKKVQPHRRRRHV